ncbi:MAG: YggT family protein [Bdellovibrionales bacterium]|nr:YggT family protein [Bdellovibrionales bacterium]
MILLANSMRGLAAILSSLIFMAEILVIARVIVSWVSADPRNRLVEIIVGSTEPMIRPFRRLVPPIGALDLSPLILLFGLLFIQYAVVQSLADYAEVLRQHSLLPTSTI